MKGWLRLWSVCLLACLALPAYGQKTVQYFHTDALGSVVAVTGANGTVTERREYEPYGAQLTPVVQDGPGYTGHVQDAETGLVYMQQRYYDPEIGRFLSVDPVTAYSDPVGMFNRYKYAANNPYRFVDPDGRQESSITRAMERDNEAYLRGEMSTETLIANREARAIGGGVGLVAVGVGYVGVRGSVALASLPSRTKGYLFVAMLSALDPDPNGENKVRGKGRIATTMQVVDSIAKVKDKAKAVAKGMGAAAAPVGTSPGQGAGGDMPAQINVETGELKVRLPSETGSRIRRTVHACVDKKKCG